MKVQAGDIIKVTNPNYEYLYNTKHIVEKVDQHPMDSDTLRYHFKINEHEGWVTSKDTKVLLEGNERDEFIQKLISLRVLVDSINMFIRSFINNTEGPAFYEHCIKLCDASLQYDKDYQQVINDYQYSQELDKNQVVYLITSYYDVLDGVEQAAKMYEVSHSIFYNIISVLQSLKNDSVFKTPEGKVYPQFSGENHSSHGGEDVVNENKDEKVNEVSVVLTDEEVNERIEFLNCQLKDDSIEDKSKIEEELESLKNKVKINEELTFKHGDKVKLKKDSHEHAVSIKNAGDWSEHAIAAYADYSPDEIYTVDDYDGSNLRVKDSKGEMPSSVNSSRFEKIEDVVNESNRNKMLFEEFITEIEDEVIKFKEYWVKNNQENPEHYPLELMSGDWFEQFMFFSSIKEQKTELLKVNETEEILEGSIELTPFYELAKEAEKLGLIKELDTEFIENEDGVCFAYTDYEGDTVEIGYEIDSNEIYQLFDSTGASTVNYSIDDFKKLLDSYKEEK